MTTALDLAPQQDTGGVDGKDLDHVWCCDPTIALCGCRLDPADVVPPDDEEWEPTCVVCADLEYVPMPCSPTCRYQP